MPDDLPILGDLNLNFSFFDVNCAPLIDQIMLNDKVCVCVCVQAMVDAVIK